MYGKGSLVYGKGYIVYGKGCVVKDILMVKCTYMCAPKIEMEDYSHLTSFLHIHPDKQKSFFNIFDDS